MLTLTDKAILKDQKITIEIVLSITFLATSGDYISNLATAL
jgi:hypothetical protein